MNKQYLVRSHNPYMPNVSRIELLEEEHLLEATIIVANTDLKDFPVGGVISVETKVVAVLKPVKKEKSIETASEVKK